MTTKQRTRNKEKEEVKRPSKKKEEKVKEENRKATKEEINIATWNLQGIFEEGAVKNLISEAKRYNIDIMMLQETHLKDSTITEIEGYILFNSGSDIRRYGTGFLVKENLKEAIRKFRPLTDRLCCIQLRAEKKNISLVNIHAPTEEKDDEEKDEYYEVLEQVYESLPRQDIKIIIGDANAKVGKEEIYKEVTGGESKHQVSNNNGERLISFATEKRMKIISTHFRRKDIHKGTWLIPGRNETNQIDHILIQQQYARLVTNVRTYRGADANSDHFLVKMRIKQPTNNNQTKKRKRIVRYDMEKLGKQENRQMYQQDIYNKITRDKTKTGEIEKEWKILEEGIKEATEKNLRQGNILKKKGWINEECKEEISKRKTLREIWLNTGKKEDKERYLSQRRIAKHICRVTKREYEEQRIRNMEEQYKNKEIRNFYNEVKKERKGYQAKMVYCTDKQGNLIANEEEMASRWKEYFEEMLNEEQITGENAENKNMEDQDEENIEKPTKIEINEIIDNLKNNKSPGDNGVTAENIKYGGSELRNRIHQLIKDIWNQELMPKTWKKAIICPIHKKGEITDCENYRGIALLDVIYKVLATLLKRRLDKYIEPLLGDYQGGFRRNRATTDQIFMMKQVLNMCQEYNIPIYLLFVDFKKAYDTIDRREVLETLEEFKVL